MHRIITFVRFPFFLSLPRHAEFKEWALNICQKYPNYKVAIIGVGDAPPDNKDIGYVSQIAIFVRRDLLNRSLVEPLLPVDCNPDVDVQYKEIFAVDFPYNIDERSKEQKLLDEARYQISRCHRIDRYFNRDLGVYQVPLTVLKDYIENIGATMDEMLCVLKENDIEVKGDYIILPEYDENDASYHHYDDCYDDEYGLWNDVGCDNEELKKEDELGACGGSSLNKDDDAYESEENWD